MDLQVFFTGMALGLGLIVAIGAQNAFVLRQGLRGEHVFAICLACAVSDAILIVAGVAGFGAIVSAAPWLDPVMRVAGAAFLALYGARSLYAALTSNSALREASTGPAPLGPALLSCLAITWLNPHVYLDTVVLLGAVSTRFPGSEAAFAAGAATGSVLFFFSLGYGAALLRPVFVKPSSWRMLEGVIGIVMWGIAAKLVLL